MEVAIADISIQSKRMRSLGDVTALAESMGKLGLLNPVILTRDNHLVAGLHRVEAAKLLGWTKIEARRIELSELEAELAQIDENLIRNDLTALERADHLARRKDIYEALHPETKAGTAGGKASGASRRGEERTSDKKSFVQDTAAKTGTSKRTVERDVQIASLPEAVKDMIRGTPVEDRKADLLTLSRMDAEKQMQVAERIAAGAETLTVAVRQLKEQERERRREQNRELIATSPVIETPAAKFATIVIDPPWDWGDEGDQDQLGRARPTYGTMPFEEILGLPVSDFADDDCHLYLWITNRSLPKGFRLIESWGFRYVTCLTWCKPSFGMGNYFRGSTEHVLFGVKGSQPLKRKDVGTWFQAKRGPKGHSSKPGEFFELVESCSPGPYFEMFARDNRDNWVSWGAEARSR